MEFIVLCPGTETKKAIALVSPGRRASSGDQHRDTEQSPLSFWVFRIAGHWAALMQTGLDDIVL
jgi:hypothetical protein